MIRNATDNMPTGTKITHNRFVHLRGEEFLHDTIDVFLDATHKFRKLDAVEKTNTHLIPDVIVVDEICSNAMGPREVHDHAPVHGSSLFPTLLRAERTDETGPGQNPLDPLLAVHLEMLAVQVRLKHTVLGVGLATVRTSESWVFRICGFSNLQGQVI